MSRIDGTFNFEEFFQNHERRDKEIMQESNDRLAETLFGVYKSFINVGFDKEQAFKLLLVQYEGVIAMHNGIL